MDQDSKASAILIAEDAGEQYAKALFLSGGVAALRAERDWMAICVQETLYERPDVSVFWYKAFVQVFARGAQRYRDIVLRGYDHEALPYPPDSDAKMEWLAKLIAANSAVYRQVAQAVRAASPTATNDDVSNAFITHFDERSLGDRPELIAGYRAGAAAYRAEHGEG